MIQKKQWSTRKMKRLLFLILFCLYSHALFSDEVDSLCQVIPMPQEEAVVALRDLKAFLHTKELLSFETLKGGDYS